MASVQPHHSENRPKFRGELRSPQRLRVSDLADKSDNAIIRPGLNFRFRLIAPTYKLVEQLRNGAKLPGRFDNGFEFVESDSPGCCGALFLMSPGGSIPRREFWRLQYFFERDEHETVVFEFNPWDTHFHARRFEEIKQRATV